MNEEKPAVTSGVKTMRALYIWRSKLQIKILRAIEHQSSLNNQR
jgi:hypothetical protein